MNLEERLNSLDARISARMADIDRRIAERLGSAASPTGDSASASVPAPAIAKFAAPRASGTRYGLYVGVNQYAVPCTPLCGCVPDAQNMATVCRDLGGWSASNQIILTDSSATVSAVRSALRSIAAKAAPGDVVLYFQSSHGGPNGPAPLSNDTCLWCHDGCYPEADLWSDFACFRKDVRLVVIIDACYSGGLFERSATPVGNLSERILARFRSAASDPSRISADTIGWITAAANGETSLDHPSASGGYFTTFTLINNGWRGGMADGFVDAILVQLGGRASLGSLSAMLHPAQPVTPTRANGFVTFLDLAVFAILTWGDWQTSDGTQHVPQCSNEMLLHSVIAGRTGA